MFIAFSLCITLVVFVGNLVGMHHVLSALWKASNRVAVAVVHTRESVVSLVRAPFCGLGSLSRQSNLAPREGHAKTTSNNVQDKGDGTKGELQPLNCSDQEGRLTAGRGEVVAAVSDPETDD